jgi:hypothetical protein
VSFTGNGMAPWRVVEAHKFTDPKAPGKRSPTLAKMANYFPAAI